MMWDVKYWDESNHEWHVGLTTGHLESAEQLVDWLTAIGWESRIDQTSGEVHRVRAVEENGSNRIAPVIDSDSPSESPAAAPRRRFWHAPPVEEASACGFPARRGSLR